MVGTKHIYPRVLSAKVFDRVRSLWYLTYKPKLKLKCLRNTSITQSQSSSGVRLQFPGFWWNALIQNKTSIISFILFPHGTLFNVKLLHIALDHYLIISTCRSISSIYYFSAVVLRSEYPDMLSWSHSNLRSIRNRFTVKPRLIYIL